MKRQSKLNKYLAGPKVNRRHTAQLKRNAHNNAILVDNLLHEDMIRKEMKSMKAKKLGGHDPDQIFMPPSADLQFEDISDEVLDAEFEEVKAD